VRTLYEATTEADVALVAATAKSVLSVITPAQFGADILGIEVSFDGATSTAVPPLVELCRSTQAGAGTSTAGTVRQTGGRVITPGFTTAYNYTSEPTVLTTVRSWRLTAFGGLLWVELPSDRGIDSDVSTGMVLRITAAAAVNCRASLNFGRC
jgi:hypothetical protein